MSDPHPPLEAVVLAGGKGTRLRPLTDTRPKPLVPFMGEPFALGLVRRLAAAGCQRTTFLVGADAAPWDGLVESGAAVGVGVAVVTEPEPLDTAGAVRQLFRDLPAGPVLVCNGDVLCDLDYAALVKAHVAAEAAATLWLQPVEDTSSFGVVVCDGDGWVRRFVEKPPPGTVDANTINAGAYVLAPDVFAPFDGDGPLSFEREVFPSLLAHGTPVLGAVIDGYFQDLGTPARYLAGHRAVLDGRCDWPWLDGLRAVGPLAAVHDSADVADGADIGAGVVVGPRCHLGPGARLADTVLHAGVTIGAEAQVRGAILGEGVTIGHGAVVGPDAVLADGTTVPPAARLP